MNLLVNGDSIVYNGAPDIAALLNECGHDGQRVAVAVNGVFMPRKKHAETELVDGDEIEIVAPMQGG